jgi:hypothetical protein
MVKTLIGKDYGEMNWHPDRAPIRISGPSCEGCKRPLLIEDGKCMCCGKEA